MAHGIVEDGDGEHVLKTRKYTALIWWTQENLFQPLARYIM
jgi:hypothetical protein